jgi:hypothetical protein
VEESELRPRLVRAQALGEQFPWRLLRSEIQRMRTHVTTHALSTRCLDTLETLLPR